MVALIDLKLKPRFFHRYTPPHNGNAQFGIDVYELKSRVCEARKGDTIELAVTENPGQGGSEHRLHVTVDETGVKSNFTIQSHSLDEDETPETDDLEFAGSTVVSLDKLKDAIQRMGDSAELSLQSDRLTVQSETETGTANVEFLEGGDHIHAIQLENGPVTSMYSTNYLKHITKLKNTVERVKLRFGNDFPLRFEVDRDQFKLEYTLAPRIEE